MLCVSTQEMMNLLNQGLSMRQTAKRLGIANSTVWKRVRHIHREGRVFYPHVQLEDIFRLQAEGLTQSQIAEKLNCTKNAIAGRLWRARKFVPKPMTRLQELHAKMDELLQYTPPRIPVKPRSDYVNRRSESGRRFTIR